MEDIPPYELNSLLAHFFFFTEVGNLNGDEFEPGTLTSLQQSFNRYLRQHGKNYNIIQDKIFEKSREALASKRKQLSQEQFSTIVPLSSAKDLPSFLPSEKES